MVDDPSLSLPIAARRPWALIVIVLLIDIGLATSGVWLLKQGLADRPRRSAPPRSGERASPAQRAARPAAATQRTAAMQRTAATQRTAASSPPPGAS